MIEAAIYNLLKNIVPTYPCHHEKVYPCVTYNIIASTERYSHDGNSNLKEIIIQVTAWEKTYNGVKTLQNSIFNALDSHKDSQIKMIYLETTTDLYEDETEVYYCVNDYRIQYVEV